MNFATKLRTYRHMMNLTQSEIADSLGIDRSAYAYYETGKTVPSSETIRTIAKIFSVPVEYLIEPAKKEERRKTATPKPGEFFLHDIQMPPLQWKDEKKETPVNQEFITLAPDEKELLVRYRLLKSISDSDRKELATKGLLSFIKKNGKNL